MADLKAIGSEKLTGQDKIKRIMEIARFKETAPTNLNETARSEYSLSMADGNNYQIVKEKQGYIIKKTISESLTEYIEPMKNRKYYSSYSQALKRLNLLAKEVNRLNENEEGVALFGEQKKFVLKTPKPAQDELPVPPVEPSAPAAATPPPVPSPELPPSPVAAAGEEGVEDMSMDMSGEEMPMDSEPEGEEMDVPSDEETPKQDGGEEKITFKTIQKLTGKLTQRIREYDSEQGLTSEDIKYVINMVLSSLDLEVLNEDDKEDILAKFEGDVEKDEENMDTEELPAEDDITSDTEVEDIQANMDIPVEGEMEEGHGAILDNIFKESKVDKVISKYFEISKKEILENQKRNALKRKRITETVKNKMTNVLKFSQTIEQELASKKFLEENFDFEFVGITNKKNLVFENKNKQVKVTPEGIVR